MPLLTRSVLYATPSDLWAQAFPKTIDASDFLPGTMTDPIKVGTGSATLTLTGFPRDAYSLVIKTVQAGELGTARVAFSSDGGLTWSPSVKVPQDGVLSVLTSRTYLSGLTAQFEPGNAPSFAFNDQWTLLTTASQEILDQLAASCDSFDSICCNPGNGGRYHLPLQSWPSRVTRFVVKDARFELLSARGFDFKGRDKLYLMERDAEIAWAQRVARYEEHPDIADSAPADFLPDALIGEDRFGIKRRSVFSTDYLDRKVYPGTRDPLNDY